jgi:hypothetical protein
MDLNEQGDAVAVVKRAQAHPKRPFRVRFFPRGGGPERVVASTREFPTVRLCGDGVAILEWEHDRTAQRLTFRDTPDAPARKIFTRPRPHGRPGIQTVACNARWFAYEVDGPKGTTLSARSLAKP